MKAHHVQYHNTTTTNYTIEEVAVVRNDGTEKWREYLIRQEKNGLVIDIKDNLEDAIERAADLERNPPKIRRHEDRF